MDEASRLPSRPKYQVFVSSTYRDLREEREAVAWEVLKIGHIPVGMENFSAEDDRGWETIRSTIDSSDYYVLILAGLYGSIDPESGLGWTEKEYQYAREKRVPVLAFVRDKKHPIPPDMVEPGESAVKLRAFVKDVEDKHLRERWTTREDLAGKVAVALLKTINSDELRGKNRPGWYRGDQLPGDQAVSSELARLSDENRRLRDAVAERTTIRLEIEPLSGTLKAAPISGGSSTAHLLDFAFFATPIGAEQLVIPLHRVEIDVCDPEQSRLLRFQEVGLAPPRQLRDGGLETDSLTISSTSSEVYITGPGRMEAHARYAGTPVDLPDDLQLRFEFRLAGAPESVVTYARMVRVRSDEDPGKPMWRLKAASDA